MCKFVIVSPFGSLESRIYSVHVNAFLNKFYRFFMSENPLKPFFEVLQPGFGSLNFLEQQSFVVSALQCLQSYHPLDVADHSPTHQQIDLEHLHQFVELLVG